MTADRYGGLQWNKRRENVRGIGASGRMERQPHASDGS
jgi:hypothetical protein